MGGDGGCAVIIDGLLWALRDHDQIRTLYLVGDEDAITPALGQAGDLAPVSYTHLTLPTICSV